MKSSRKNKSFSPSLLHWYDWYKRDLPWRLRKANPYKTWISEIMLQQTQVETVIPYYLRFLKEFPTVVALAQAPLERVLTFWSGLGYYSRARNLHQSAQILVQKWGGRFPKTKEGLLLLPGIGEYTAGAIASIAFEGRVPVVDGNVIRVLTRVFALDGDPKKKPLKETLWNLAQTLLPRGRTGDYNQALMELGALVCTSEGPLCHRCPLQKRCEAYQQGRVAHYPTPQTKEPTKNILLVAALIQRKNSFLLVQRGEARHLQAMWEFPQLELKSVSWNAQKLSERIQKRWQVEVECQGVLPMVRHSIMNRRIRLLPLLCRYAKGSPKIGNDYQRYRWIEAGELIKFPTSSINHKIVERLQKPTPLSKFLGCVVNWEQCKEPVSRCWSPLFPTRFGAAPKPL